MQLLSVFRHNKSIESYISNIPTPNTRNRYILQPFCVIDCLIYHGNTVIPQLKVPAIFIINSLGTSDRVLKALPYTTIEFDNPKLSNAKDRSDISAKINKGIFDSVAAGIPIPIAINMAQQLSDNEFSLSSELMEQIEERQTANDAYNDEKRELELETMRVSLETAKNPPVEGSGGVKKPAGAKPKPADGEKKGHSYSEKLEQKKHEKVGGNRTKNVKAVEEGKKLQ